MNTQLVDEKYRDLLFTDREGLWTTTIMLSEAFEVDHSYLLINVEQAIRAMQHPELHFKYEVSFKNGKLEPRYKISAGGTILLNVLVHSRNFPNTMVRYLEGVNAVAAKLEKPYE